LHQILLSVVAWMKQSGIRDAKATNQDIKKYLIKPNAM